MRKATGVFLMSLPLLAWAAGSVVANGWLLTAVAICAVSVICGVVFLGAWLAFD